jgi:hypothetical protein
MSFNWLNINNPFQLLITLKKNLIIFHDLSFQMNKINIFVHSFYHAKRSTNI